MKPEKLSAAGGLADVMRVALASGTKVRSPEERQAPRGREEDWLPHLYWGHALHQVSSYLHEFEYRNKASALERNKPI